MPEQTKGKYTFRKLSLTVGINILHVFINSGGTHSINFIVFAHCTAGVNQLKMMRPPRAQRPALRVE